MQAEGTSLSASETHRATSRNRLVGLLVGIATVALVVDQGTKQWALAALDQGDPVEVVGSLLRLNLTFNPGAAFSIGTNMTWVLTLIACVVIGVTIYYARRLHSLGWAVALGLLIGGALGNLGDRFFRDPGFARGHVVDFLQLPNWPIFNVADICVVTAACLIVLLSLRGIGIDGTREGDDREDTAAGEDSGDDTTRPENTEEKSA